MSICIDFAEHAFILGFRVLRAARGAIGIVGCVLGLGGVVICARVVSKGGGLDLKVVCLLVEVCRLDFLTTLVLGKWLVALCKFCSMSFLLFSRRGSH